MPKEPKKHNALSAGDRFRLCQALDRDRESVKKLTTPKLAKKYAGELQVELTPSNIRSALVAVGITQDRSPKASKARNGVRLERLEKLVTVLCERLGESPEALLTGE